MLLYFGDQAQNERTVGYLLEFRTTSMPENFVMAPESRYHASCQKFYGHRIAPLSRSSIQTKQYGKFGLASTISPIETPFFNTSSG